MEVLWFYIISCHLQKDSFSSSFWIWIHFISFYPLWFIWLGLLVSCWIVMGKVASRVLFLILEKNFQPFIIEYEVSCEFVIYMTFTILRFISSVCWVFLFFFHEKNSLFCKRVFLHLLRWLYFFLFYSINMVYYTDWFVHVESSLHHKDALNHIFISLIV